MPRSFALILLLLFGCGQERLLRWSSPVEKKASDDDTNPNAADSLAQHKDPKKSLKRQSAKRSTGKSEQAADSSSDGKRDIQSNGADQSIDEIPAAKLAWDGVTMRGTSALRLIPTE